ncbi:undecaprenyl diphosphate synthase family protein [Acetobacteraceae bacterium]|nr:undecaprenyl diphosphate synthase family protein [Candidatus Parcubacteria bacterium]
MKIPKRIAIIPDGSRTWAEKQGLPATYGHNRGLKVLQEVIPAGFDMGAVEIAVWGASIENLLGRPSPQTRNLCRLFKFDLKRRERMGDENTRFLVNGLWERHIKDPELSRLIKAAEERTKSHLGRTLIVLFGYSGWPDDILHAAEALQKSGEDVSMESFHRNLISSSVSLNVDLIIRTGGNRHSSAGFLACQAACAEWYVAEEDWPDFSVEKLQAAFDYFATRPRKNGK